MAINFKTCDISEIVKLSADDLTGKNVFGGIGTRVLEIERRTDYNEAGKLLSFLRATVESNAAFEQQHLKLYRSYVALVTWLRFLSIPFLLDSELKKLFTENLVTGLKMDLGIREAVKELFQSSWDPYLRGEKRDMLLRAFSENSESLGKYTIESKSAGREIPATVKNIILDYNSYAKIENERGSLEELGYLDSSPHMRGRTSKERELVLKVLQVYDFVRYPPVYEMAREMVVSPIKMTGQRIEKRGLPQQPLQTPGGTQPEKAAVPLDPLEILKQKYHSYRAQRQQVLKFEDEILVKTKGDIEAIKRELSVASRNNDTPRVIACLKVFARQGALAKVLRSSPAWIEAVGTYVQKQYSGSYSEQDVSHAVSTLRADPTTPAAFSEFLQYLLKEKLQMSENDSALVGVEVSQLMGGQYQSIAFGNQATGNFEWAKGEIKNNELVIKSE